MRIGCCTNMLAAGSGGTGAEYIGLLAGLGFDYVELPVAELMELDDRAFSKVSDELDRRGIPCEACNNLFPRHMRLTGPEVDSEAVFDYVRRAAERLNKLGAKIAAFGSGPAKTAPPGYSLSAARDQLVSLLSEIAPVAEEYEFTLAIEPLRHEECNLINTFGEACSLADAVGADRVNVLVDYYHYAGEKEDARHIAIMGRGRLVHAHFARVEGRVFPRDIGEDGGYQPFIKALELAGYGERISVEAYSALPTEDAAAGLRFMRTYFGGLTGSR